jgi:hypothetical protein
MALRPGIVLAAVASLGAGSLAAQGEVRGLAYDSLLNGPLAGAEIEVRGTARHTTVTANGRFRLDSVPVGRQVLVLSHPGLDSAGFYGMTVVVNVEAGRVATAEFGVPSLRTVWRRRCGAEFAAGADSGVVLGIVSDAASRNRLAGAGVVATWLDLRQTGAVEATREQRTVATLTDSTGSYATCGVGADATVFVRAYGSGDSTGAIQVRPGGRPVTRRDFTVGRAVRGAAVAGTIRGAEGRPIVGARIDIDNTTTTTREDGSFRLAGVPPGTQWLIVRTVGRPPHEQIVDLRDGETLALDITVGLEAVTLDTIRVRANRVTAALQELDDRRRASQGYFRDEKDIAGRPDVGAAFQGIPSVEVRRPRGGGFFVLLPAISATQRGCVARVFLDGQASSYDEVGLYSVEEIKAIEVFPRPSAVPLKYATTDKCGVVLVWTKYLR